MIIICIFLGGVISVLLMIILIMLEYYCTKILVCLEKQNENTKLFDIVNEQRIELLVEKYSKKKQSKH